ncbi:hypothetical protein ACET3Z_021846 [Daucus carota]
MHLCGEIMRVSYVCASKMTSRGEEFMQPYLAPDEAFLEVLRYSRFTYMFKQCSTDYIVAFQDSDGKQQLCIITYGCRPLEKRFSPYETTCYVALSFYDIPDKRWWRDQEDAALVETKKGLHARPAENLIGLRKKVTHLQMRYMLNKVVSGSLTIWQIGSTICILVCFWVALYKISLFAVSAMV